VAAATGLNYPPVLASALSPSLFLSSARLQIDYSGFVTGRWEEEEEEEEASYRCGCGGPCQSIILHTLIRMYNAHMCGILLLSEERQSLSAHSLSLSPSLPLSLSPSPSRPRAVW
jgi:hypothetical protein